MEVQGIGQPLIENTIKHIVKSRSLRVNQRLCGRGKAHPPILGGLWQWGIARSGDAAVFR